MIKKVYLLLLTIALSLGLSGCGYLSKEYKLKIDTNLESANIIDDYRVFYQIFIGSFSDSNGDGIGDLNGIIKRFDYLNDGKDNSGKSLGVEGLWLSPMMPSSSYHKYDVQNYYEIDSKFGSLDNFKKLLELAHSRDVRIIIDLVVNHTSIYHPWFKAFKEARQNNDSTNQYFDYYTAVHETERLRERTYYPIYKDSKYYYEGNFSSEMPELNFDNPLVKDEFKEIIKFWLEMGVDGFRLDAIKYIYFEEHERNIEFWGWFTDTAKSYNENVYLVGEAWDRESVMIPYYENFNNFDFSFSQAEGFISRAAKTSTSVSEYTQSVSNYLDRVYSINSNAIISPFIANHDMDRAAGYLPLYNGSMFMAASLYILGPGNPFIYYGEEIGLKGVRGTSNTDANRRLKMPWGDNDKVKNPVGSSYDEDLQTNGTVKQQVKDKNSLYNHYKKLIQIRKAYPAIARGTYTPLTTDIFTLGGFISTYQGESILVIHNTGEDSLTIDLNDLKITNFSLIAASVGVGKKATLKAGKITIDGLTTVILK